MIDVVLAGDGTKHPIHPVLEGTTSQIESWAQWLNLWHNAPVTQVRMGLLHYGLNVPYASDLPHSRAWKKVSA